MIKNMKIVKNENKNLENKKWITCDLKVSHNNVSWHQNKLIAYFASNRKLQCLIRTKGQKGSFGFGIVVDTSIQAHTG